MSFVFPSPLLLQVPNPINAYTDVGTITSTSLEPKLGSIVVDNANEVAYMLLSKLNGTPVWKQIITAGFQEYIKTINSILPATGGNFTIESTDGTVTINSVTNGIDLSASLEAFTWTSISSSQTLAVRNGYFCSSGGTLSLALPAISAVGNVISVALNGATGFTITQAANQHVTIGKTTSTVGVGGSVSSTGQGDSITIVCSVANLGWFAVPAPTGNLTIV